MIIVNFIRDQNVGIYARLKRPSKEVRSAARDVELDGGCADEETRASGCEGEEKDCAPTKRRK